MKKFSSLFNLDNFSNPRDSGFFVIWFFSEHARVSGYPGVLIVEISWDFVLNLQSQAQSHPKILKNRSQSQSQNFEKSIPVPIPKFWKIDPNPRMWCEMRKGATCCVISGASYCLVRDAYFLDWCESLCPLTLERRKRLLCSKTLTNCSSKALV